MKTTLKTCLCLTVLLSALSLPLAASDGTFEAQGSAPVQSQSLPRGLELDTVKVKVERPINDYFMIGVQYGASLCGMLWNPEWPQERIFTPVNVGILFTGYNKMFNYLPYFGWQLGVFYTQEGFRLQQNISGRTRVVDQNTKESEATFTTVEVPFMAHFHVDFWKMKLMANLGFYGGYRLTIHRGGPYAVPEYQNSFMTYNRRFDYGIKGGLGVGFIFDPIEIHLTAGVKVGLGSIYDPNYYSPYYYRFASPFNFIFSIGVHYQLSHRIGRTEKELREEALRRIAEME
ncbi:MAG: outer membrane beta-barrel protein [Bacteroidales bacterium]|nr:outer membrane beta-barrel protein [Bacteroidales bacterium]